MPARGPEQSAPASSLSSLSPGPAVDDVDEGGDRQPARGAVDEAVGAGVAALGGAAAAEIDRHRPRAALEDRASACGAAPACRPRSRRRRSGPARHRSRRPAPPRRGSARRPPAPGRLPAPARRPPPAPTKTSATTHSSPDPLDRSLPALSAHAGSRREGRGSLPLSAAAAPLAWPGRRRSCHRSGPRSRSGGGGGARSRGARAGPAAAVGDASPPGDHHPAPAVGLRPHAHIAASRPGDRPRTTTLSVVQRRGDRARRQQRARRDRARTRRMPR